MSRIYLVTKLFNVNDRFASLDLCEHVDGWIDEGTLTGLDHCFLPYRDSNGDIPETVEDLSYAIFEKDVETIQGATALAGYYDGPSYDPGIGFELGYAFSLGKPLMPMTTDYFTRTIFSYPETYAISHYMEYLANVIHVPGAFEDLEDYQAILEEIRATALSQLRGQMVEYQSKDWAPKVAPPQALPIEYDYYFDPNFKYSEAGRKMLDKLIASCHSVGSTYVVGDNQVDIAADIKNISKSRTVILFTDEFEFDVDSALIQGLSYGLGKEIYLYSSKVNRYVQSDKLMLLKNPMNYNSAKAIISTEEALLALIEKEC